MSKRRYKGPDEYKPVSAWGYYGLSLLYLIPIVGWICFLVFTFEGSNINRRNYTRSIWCRLLVRLIVLVLICAVGMIALRVTPAQVPGRVKNLIEGVKNLAVTAANGESTYEPGSPDVVTMLLNGSPVVVHAELKEDLDRAEALVDTFVGMAAEGRTGQADLMGLAVTNLGTITKVLSLRDANLTEGDAAYFQSVYERCEQKLSAVDFNSLDLSWAESLGIRF